MLKIYGAKTFNAVKAVLAAEECGADYEYVEMDFTKGEHKQPAYLKIHPLGKIPAMEHNGSPIFESNNMCRYIANISNKRLYSDDPLKASQIDQMVDLIGYHIGRWITVYFFEEIVKSAFRGEDPDQAALEEAAGFLSDQLPYLDGVLEKNDFLCGDEISIADCVAFAMIMASEYTSFSIDDYPNIARWYNQMKARPSHANMMKHFPGGYSFD